MSLHRRIILSSETNGPDLYQYSSSPPLPTNVLLSDSSTAVPFQRHLSNAAIAVVSSVSAAIFLALTYYSVLRHRRRRLLNRSDDSFSSAGDETSDEDDDDGGAHHVWNIRTVGLDNSAILSIGSYAYLPPSGTDGGSLTVTADCPVCLGELEDGDMVRLLPKCGHVFHVSCIDTWLRAHVTCPLCRVHVLPPQPSAAEGVDGETRVRVLSDTEDPPPPEEEEVEEDDDPGSPIDHRSVTTETDMEEKGCEERKDDNSEEEEEDSKVVEVPSSPGSGRVFFFARMSRGRSSSILPL